VAENAVNTGVSRQGASPPEPPSSRRRQKINGAGRSRTLPRLFGGIQMEQNEIRKEDYEKGGEVRSAPMKNEYRVSFYFRKDKGKTLEQKIREIILRDN
jgi:hypothetical protein